MKLYKNEMTNAKYADFAVYCNNNGLIIEDKGDYLEAVNLPEPTVEELQAQVRAVRNSYLETYVDPKQLVLVWDSLSADDKKLYADYRQYLLDYPQTEGWYEQNPMTLDEWKQSVDQVSDQPTDQVDDKLSQVAEEVVISKMENAEENKSEEVVEDGLQR